MNNFIMTNTKSTAELFAQKHAGSEDCHQLAFSLVAHYDKFMRECNGRDFTPTYKLFTLWMEATNHRQTKVYEYNPYSLFSSH
jgi:hypothetical protein